MITLDQIKITRRDQQFLKLRALGCSNKDIAAERTSAHAPSSNTCAPYFCAPESNRAANA